LSSPRAINFCFASSGQRLYIIVSVITTMTQYLAETAKC
jgi:hypothetical protein